MGFVIYKAFQFVDKRYPRTHRIPILALVLCFGFSYVAEHVFGIADITGAYVAGIILCSLRDSDYIEEKLDIHNGYAEKLTDIAKRIAVIENDIKTLYKKGATA